MLIAFVARWGFVSDFSPWDGLILAVLLTLAGLWGDLVESAIKRSVGVKDSGAVAGSWRHARSAR